MSGDVPDLKNLVFLLLDMPRANMDNVFQIRIIKRRHHVVISIQNNVHCRSVDISLLAYADMLLAAGFPTYSICTSILEVL